MGTLGSGSIDLKSLKVAGEGATSYITKINEGGIFISPSNQSPIDGSEGNSTKINGDGMEVFNEGISIAKFGSLVRIGEINGFKTIIESNSFQLQDNNDFSFLRCSSNNVDTEEPCSETLYYLINGNSTYTYTIKNTIVTGKNILVYINSEAGGLRPFVFTAGTSGNNGYGNYYTINYNATNNKITITTISQTACRLVSISYTIITKEPFFKFGSTRDDGVGYSSTLGKQLTATGTAQTVIGRYNTANSNCAFIVGNGELSGNAVLTSNALTVDWNGNLWAEGNITSANLQVTTPTISITTGSGYTLNSYTVKQYGNIVQLHIRVRNNSSTAIGGNLYSGTINTTALRPIMTTTSASYYDKYSFPATISTAGAIVVRNANATAFSALTGDNYVNVSFTYIVA